MAVSKEYSTVPSTNVSFLHSSLTTLKLEHVDEEKCQFDALVNSASWVKHDVKLLFPRQ
jgi:hypothetical protein